jgi:TPR repeat protein
LYSLNFNYQNDSNSSFNDLLSSCNENDFLLSCYSAETIYLNFKSSDLKISDTLANLESYCDRNEYYSCLAVTKVLDFIDKQTKSDSELNKEEANSRYKELEKLKLPFRIKACDGGLALACSDLAVYYQVETMGKKFISSNPGLAWTKYELYAVRACEYGHVGQCSFVGSFLLNGHTTTVYINEDDETGQELHAIRKNPELAFKMFNISCNARQKLECNSLGWMYERGIFIDKDVSKAQELYTIACEKDYYGCFNLGALLMRKGNYNDAEQYFIKALQITQDNNSEVYKITRSALFDIYKEKNDRLNANKYAEISCDLSSVDACKYIVLNNISPDGTKINPLGLVYLFKACKLRDENSCELLEIHLNYLCAVGNSKACRMKKEILQMH